MNAGVAVFARLTAQTSAGARIYPLLLPQGPTYPAITYQQISARRLRAMGEDGPLVAIRMQINAWGRTYAEARTLAAEIEGRLSRYRGEAGTVTVHDSFLEAEVDMYESDSQTRRVVQDYTLYLSVN